MSNFEIEAVKETVNSSAIPDEGWPTTKLLAGLAAVRDSNRPRAVLLSTGSLNPVHVGHISIMESARSCLEGKGYDVVAGYLSATHDNYVSAKMRNVGGKNLRAHFSPSEQRVRMVELSCQDSSWLDAASWEANQDTFVDFPDVLQALNEFLVRNGLLEPSRDEVFYVCGLDHYKNCYLHLGVRCDDRKRNVIVVPRNGVTESSKSPFVFFAEPNPSQHIQSISSTKLRAALERDDYENVRSMSTPLLADYLINGDGAILYRTRKIFISFSAMYHRMRSEGPYPKAVLEDSLFFFGSKKFWFWPENNSQLLEAETAEYAKRLQRFPEFAVLLKAKYDRGEVCFLKKNELGPVDVDGGIFGDFHGASDWLVSQGYPPLLLQPSAWDGLVLYNADLKTKNVVDNFERGLHDYCCVIELIMQSCQGLLKPILY